MSTSSPSPELAHDFEGFVRALQVLVEDVKGKQDAVVQFPPPPSAVRAQLPVDPPVAGGGFAAATSAMQAYLEAALPTISPRFMNQLWSGASLPGALGEVLAALSNTSMYTYEVAPAATLIERSLLRHMRDKVGFDVDGEGIFVTGGTNANHVAMLMAREEARRTSVHLDDGDTHMRPRRGMRDSKPLVAFCSEEAHYSFETSAHIMGFEPDQLVKVKADADGRLDPAALQHALHVAREAGFDPFFVAATSGTTVKGAFDPLHGIADVLDKDAEHHPRLWFHIDGAWGGAAALSERHKDKLDGAARAQSFTWDTHKLMGLPLICSVILVNGQGHLQRTQGAQTHGYLFHDDTKHIHDDEGDGKSLNMGKLSLACGRRPESLKLWLAWHASGDDGFAARIDHLSSLQEHARRRVRDSDVLVEAAPGTWMNLCFTLNDDDKLTLQSRQVLADEGLCLVNHASVGERAVLRMIFSNPLLTVAHLDAIFDRLEDLARSAST